MLSLKIRSGLAAVVTLVLLSAVVVATATANAQTTSSISFIASQPASQHNAGDMIGAIVVTPTGERLGDVNYLLVEDGRLQTAVIGIGGMLGMGEKNVAVPFADLKPADTPASERRRFSLAATADDIARAPAFQWVEKPIAVRIEDGVKSAAQKVKETAKDLSEKASEAMKGSSGKPAEPKTQP